jgi:hypothetical protein
MGAMYTRVRVLHMRVRVLPRGYVCDTCGHVCSTRGYVWCSLSCAPQVPRAGVQVYSCGVRERRRRPVARSFDAADHPHWEARARMSTFVPSILFGWCAFLGEVGFVFR